MFRLPNFNLTCNVWTTPNAPPAAPDFAATCQLRLQGTYSTIVPTPNNNWTQAVALFPAGTDLRTINVGAAADSVIEIPAGSGRFYYSVIVEDVAKGFANEHRAAYLVQTPDFGAWPFPIP